MLTRSLRKTLLLFLPMLMFLLGTSGVSSAAEYWLRAEPVTKTMPDGAVITMWGYALDLDNSFTTLTDGVATVPGPVLTVLPGESLTIHLYNNGLPEPVSIVIPGQTIAPTPVRNADGRVRSFTAETAPLTEGLYTWASIKPGTYLYQSGTHPAVQVQMGLYGAMKNDAALGQAYGATTAYDADALLLFSEIDPLLHIAVAMGNYGPGLGVTSTMDYEPKYFLINGEPFSYGVSAIPAGASGQRILLRFLNAGLKDHVAALQDLYMAILAEDGNLFPFLKNQYSMLLPAGKTMDAMITPAAPGYIPVYDRRLSLTNGTNSPGGLLTHLQVASPLQYALTAAKTGSGRVVAASAPAGIDCGLDCTETYNDGTVLRLAAMPDPGAQFLGWTCAADPGGDCTTCTGTGDCIVAVTANTAITAAFTQVYTITVAAGAGGTISPSGTVPVPSGASQTFTITPNTGYRITNVFVDGVAQGAISTYTFTNVTANHNISATFVLDTFTINAAAGAGGTITPSGTVTVPSGASQTFTITPNTGYRITNVFVDGVAQGAITTHTFTNVTANHNISARFAAITFTINAAAGTGGTITPSGAVTVNYGANQTFTITPNAGYRITNVFVDGVSQGAISTYTFTNVTANHNISVNFALDTFTINASAGTGGTITPSGTVTVNSGANQTFTITPDIGYHITNVFVDGVSVGAASSYTFNNVTTNHNISARFAINTYTINAVAGTGGTITCTPSNPVNYGTNVTCSIAPDNGYHITGVFVDGVSQGVISTYTFNNVTANHNMSARFALN